MSKIVNNSDAALVKSQFKFQIMSHNSVSPTMYFTSDVMKLFFSNSESKQNNKILKGSQLTVWVQSLKINNTAFNANFIQFQPPVKKTYFISNTAPDLYRNINHTYMIPPACSIRHTQ